jgi:hypothetical protein
VLRADVVLIDVRDVAVAEVGGVADVDVAHVGEACVVGGDVDLTRPERKPTDTIA